MSKYKTVQGIVINKKPTRDNDLIITLLTPNEGKIVCLAKGARSIKSHRLGHLQLGNILKVSIYQKGDFRWLTESQTLQAFLQTPKKLVQLNLLFLFLEFINQLVPENQINPGLYQICQKIIKAIDKNQFKSYINYEINLIQLLGFGTPPEIINAYQANELKTAQNLIKNFLESIIEKPVKSNQLFR
ncbi:MAG TPA: DNA repair protein RecO [Candidatus Woesebacteria bacterium]|nr:DNA repair protein RecO [Candidatus Woesebacteria bacterium]HRS22824.1 DNA repair protein RecO [Candidatus Woesebacteria bacterium]HRT40104.1 DNA repair protein RecO [Candidatus Woesebacteria bacterium]